MIFSFSGLFLYFIIATKGRGVHILKPGSKRRRTQVDMQAQLEFEDIIQADSAANASKIKDQSEQIQILEAQL